jgi:hypothetical protein
MLWAQAFRYNLFESLKSFPSKYFVMSQPSASARYSPVNRHVAFLGCPQMHHRYHAAEALAALGPNAEEARPALEKSLLEDDSAYVRKSAALALGELGRGCSAESMGRTEAVLKRALQDDEDRYVRERAGRALHVLAMLRDSAILRDIAAIEIPGIPDEKVRQEASDSTSWSRLSTAAPSLEDKQEASDSWSRLSTAVPSPANSDDELVDDEPCHNMSRISCLFRTSFSQ